MFRPIHLRHVRGPHDHFWRNDHRLDRLEKAGLIKRAPNPEDRRGTHVSLTEEGLDTIDRIVPLHVENETQALAGLSREEQETLDRLLGKLIAGLDAS
ncbi:MarR family winged helix-turn-helix transcriptional regulator [Modicisalibacter xianhensis]|uniref:MarR family winged helix-turn-helix transcriptional regulator n=1 Tax=Modicisalibacter xianhensis TaxID=442341 RepID=UPI001FD0FCF1|nr:winged helix DNA-binding protein [Halomonas xianhensis]